MCALYPNKCGNAFFILFISIQIDNDAMFILSFQVFNFCLYFSDIVVVESPNYPFSYPNNYKGSFKFEVPLEHNSIEIVRILLLTYFKEMRLYNILTYRMSLLIVV